MEAVKSLREVLGLLGEQIEQLRPGKKRSADDVSAAKGTATLVNSYIGIIRVGMQYAKMNGEKPNLEFLNANPRSKNLKL